MGKVQKNKSVDALALKRKLSKQFSKEFFNEDGSFNYKKFKKAEDKIKQNLQETNSNK